MLFGKPPDRKCMEVYNDYNSNLANLFYCVKNRTGSFLRELGFLPINSRDEFTVIRKFVDKQEFDLRFLKEELELAERYLPPPDFEEIRQILLENAEVTDVKRAAAFSNSSGTAMEAAVHRLAVSPLMCGGVLTRSGRHPGGFLIQSSRIKILRR